MAEDPLKTMIDRVKLDPETCITPANVVEWAGSLSNWDFYNAISLQLAEMYQAGALSYRICDHLMNDLWTALQHGFVDGQSNKLPYPFFDVYEAFDAGEFHRNLDRSDDPVATYTDPLIRELLLRNSRRLDGATAAAPDRIDS